jgi:putative addiction module component (TIGR02574 family)
MNAKLRELFDFALQLPDQDRADLAASLLESLDQPFDADAPEAWAEEISRRLADLDNGSVRPIPWDEARQDIAGPLK